MRCQSGTRKAQRGAPLLTTKQPSRHRSSRCPFTLPAPARGAPQVFGTDLYAVKKRLNFWERPWNATDLAYGAFLGGVHLVALAAPFTFSWPMLGLFLATYFVSGCLGITLSFHRQLSHRSFQTPKWLEYALAYCGVLAVQVRRASLVRARAVERARCRGGLSLGVDALLALGFGRVVGAGGERF